MPSHPMTPQEVRTAAAVMADIRTKQEQINALLDQLVALIGEATRRHEAGAVDRTS